MLFQSIYKKLIFCLAIIVSGSIYAETYYLSPAGNDNASGTSASEAWQTISKLNSLDLSPGTIILFEGGQIFNGSVYLSPSDANDPLNTTTISSYGTGRAIINSGAAYGLYAYNTQGIVISNLVFSGSGMNSNTGNGILFYADAPGDKKFSNVNIRNVEVYGYGKNGIVISSNNGNTGFKNVVIDSTHVHHIRTNGITTSGYTSQTHVGWAHENITIKNTEADNIPGFSDPDTHKGSGIIMGQVNNGLIERCVAHHTGADNTHCGGPGGIWAWDCNDLTIQHCESYLNKSGTGCDGLGFDFDGGMTNSTMQYNYSHDNDGAGYLLGQYDNARPWSNNIIRFNISENDGRTNGGGITLFKGINTVMNGAKIYNNTVYITPSSLNNAIGAFTITDWHKGIAGTEVYNNIFQTTGGVALVDVPAGYDAYFAGNLYWSSGTDFKIYYQGPTYTNLADWRTATGNEQVGSTATGITANPAFNGAGNGIIIFPNPTEQLNAYKLSTGSPATDAGLDIASLFGISRGSRDFFSNAIYDGSIADIGAHDATLSTGIAAATGGNSISVYPNPVKSGNPIIIKATQFPYSAELISITGARVWSEQKIESQEYQVPTYNLAAGVYILSVKDKNSLLKLNKIVIN